MLRIIHTADWHIGKNLHKVPMQDEIRLFFDWLVEVIVQRDVDLLLVSGDIFDYANPSAEDRQMYFHFLMRLIGTQTKVIITGGNHDSAGFLNAPREILDMLDVIVVGEATDELKDELVEVLDKDGEVQLVVAAVPFLKDKDLRHKLAAGKYNTRTEEIRAGIAKHYADLAEICTSKYAGMPVIAMGHLYAVGADPSESERDIHMGNEAAVGASAFTKVFDYVALGHIHRPQVVGGNEFVRYSGSPISLSFSEKMDMKSIVFLEVNDAAIARPELIPVPKHRELVRLNGTLAEVKEALGNFQNSYSLPAFLELGIKEESFSTWIVGEVEALKQQYSDDARFRIIKSKTDFKRGARDIEELFAESESIEELKPIQVFEKKIDAEGLEEELGKELKEMFISLLDRVENEN